MSANNEQIGGTNYRDMDIQPLDAMRAWMSPEQFCGYLLGTAIAYLARVNVAAPGKGGIDDIEKARHVLAKLAETWNFRIFNEFPKEVMSVVGETASSKRPVDPPAVSESAAGDAPMYNGMPEKAWLLLAEIHADASYLFGRVAADGSVAGMMAKAVRDKIDKVTEIFHPKPAPASTWPGPDWSQAPDVSQFTRDRINGWKMGRHGIAFWLIDGGIWGQAPGFNYPGHWRDSLRQRP